MEMSPSRQGCMGDENFHHDQSTLTVGLIAWGEWFIGIFAVRNPLKVILGRYNGWLLILEISLVGC